MWWCIVMNWLFWFSLFLLSISFVATRLTYDKEIHRVSTPADHDLKILLWSDRFSVSIFYF